MNREYITYDFRELPIKISEVSLYGSKGKYNNKIHFHSEAELVYIISGVISCTFEDREIKLSKGSVIFINSIVPHRLKAVIENSNCLYCQFDINNFLGINNDYKYLNSFINHDNEHSFLEIDNTDFIEHIEHIYNEFKTQGKAYEHFIKSDIYYIIAYLERIGFISNIHSSQGDNTLKKLLPAIKYVNSNLSAKFTIDDVATEIGINKYYFCRLFKTLVGNTFTEYLTFARLIYAEKLMESSDKSILEISFESGFSSVQYFNKVYKKYRGITPNKYRKLHKP